MTPNLWNNTYTLFLFDRQLIYCKKDLLKRTNYIYKGRIFLDNCRILNLPDGKIFGVTLKNALRIYCDTRNKWFDFCFRSSSSKLRFLNTLSAERQFCGQNLFVSELAGLDDDNILSDREYGVASDRVDYNSEQTTTGTEPMNTDDGGGITRHNERGIDVENINTLNIDNESIENKVTTAAESQGKYKKSDTLPKKSRKLHKEPTVTSYEYHSNSLGRKRIGNWFRKAKSTNTTPSQSPTHQPMSSQSVVVSTTGAVCPSDSSSQSSPALYLRPPNKATTIMASTISSDATKMSATNKHKNGNIVAATS